MPYILFKLLVYIAKVKYIIRGQEGGDSFD